MNNARLQAVQDEIFDIVNDKDEVVGQSSRQEVHRRGWKHRAVHLLIFNGKGEIFLQKRSMLKDNNPGTWDSSAAGHVDTGESYDACVLREAREELGLELPCLPEKVLRIPACEQTGQEFVWVYHCRHEGPFHLNRAEIETGGWFAPDAVSRWIEEKPEEFAPSLICIWRQLDPLTNRPA